MVAGCLTLSETDGARSGFAGGARSIGLSAVSAGSAAVGSSVTLGRSIGVVLSLGAKIELAGVVVAAGLIDEKIDGAFILLANNGSTMNRIVSVLSYHSLSARTMRVSLARASRHLSEPEY